MDDVPLNTPKTTTILSSIRVSGQTIPAVFEGALNGKRFLEYLKVSLLPFLGKGDIVIMGNLGSHKVEGVRELITSVEAHLVYLPPYSPDLNPIEQLWSKIKAYFRKLKLRTTDQLRTAIPSAFSQVSGHDCLAWFRNVGYSC